MKTMVTILLLVSAISYGQRGERSEKLRAYKTAFLTEQLNLSPAEAEKFWPVYNSYDGKLMELRRIERKEILPLVKGDIDNLTEKEANVLLENILELKSKEFKYHQEMDEELRNVLSSKKILKLKLAEEVFKMQLLERVRGKHGQGHP